MTIRQALLMMGYREEKSGCWMKPIGYQLFTYREDKNEWANYFKSAQDKIECWNTSSFKNDEKQFGSYLAQLKGFECWTRTDICTNSNSQFELSTINL